MEEARGSLEVLNKVFDNMFLKSSIFRNRDALRHDYIPNHLPHRENEIKYVGEVVAPLLLHNKASNLFIYGKPGTGKTAVIRFVFNALSKKANELRANIKCVLVNSRLEGSEYRILASISRQIGLSIPFTGLATAEVFRRIVNHIKANNLYLLVALDEIDVIVKKEGENLLYELSRINENFSSHRVSFIGISNEITFKQILDPRILSTLSEEELVFKPYSSDELFDILMERAREAFHNGVCDPSVIRYIAALSASEHGDARRALDLLRVSAETAERGGKREITVECVQEALRKIERDQVNEVIRTLPIQSKVLLISILKNLRNPSAQHTSGEIYTEYRSLVTNLGLESLTDRRLSSLLNELESAGIISSKIVNMGRYGRTKKYSLSVPQAHIVEALKEGDLLNGLLE
ncbi:MAG: AAA family ATPase [Candidatus Brockarchaeota archaeon]|nr:AAA family ATPase [Candidatus Brockarchaeota archaeon]